MQLDSSCLVHLFHRLDIHSPFSFWLAYWGPCLVVKFRSPKEVCEHRFQFPDYGSWQNVGSYLEICNILQHRWYELGFTVVDRTLQLHPPSLLRHESINGWKCTDFGYVEERGSHGYLIGSVPIGIPNKLQLLFHSHAHEKLAFVLVDVEPGYVSHNFQHLPYALDCLCVYFAKIQHVIHE